MSAPRSEYALDNSQHSGDKEAGSQTDAMFRPFHEGQTDRQIRSYRQQAVAEQEIQPAQRQDPVCRAGIKIGEPRHAGSRIAQ